MSQPFKFCILAAGHGSRNQSLKGLHKALLPVGNRPVISLILDKVDKSVPIVVALGHLGDQIKTYLEKTHSDRTFEFVEVENYSGPGSGPGLSLLKCESVMQCPFIFTSADTIVDQESTFFAVSKNWVGVSQISNNESHEYCLVEVEGKLVKSFFYGTNKSAHAFTGIAGVRDYQEFWEGLKQRNMIRKEHQVLDGLRSIRDVHVFNMSWLDTGNLRSYNRAKSYYPNNLAIEKDNEAIFVDNGYVVKYFEDSSRAYGRMTRQGYLGKSAPSIFKINDKMFGYKYIEGCPLSDIYDRQIFIKFLEDYEMKFRATALPKNDAFLDNCKLMYQQKTFNRIKPLVDTHLDKIGTINGVSVKPIKTLLEEVDWSAANEKSIPSLFHGDLQPENILVARNGEYFYIDWREGFGKSPRVGDTYYDLAKLYHALEISNNLVLQGAYDVKINTNSAVLKYTIKNNLYQFSKDFERFCTRRGYDFQHIKFLSILNYLNIAPLYDKFEGGKYGKFLFLLGKKLLTQHLEEVKNYE